MKPIQAYTGQILTFNSLITFGSRIAKKPGTRPTALNPWTYDGIFLGYQNTVHNIQYWDVHTCTIKIAKHDSKDEIQYGDDVKKQIFSISASNEIIHRKLQSHDKVELEMIELDLKDKATPSTNDVLNEMLQIHLYRIQQRQQQQLE